MKYANYQVTFREVPDEISLCINISNCPVRCADCHSKYLWEDVGQELTITVLHNLINMNKGITCVCFMGGNQETEYLKTLIKQLRNGYPALKIALYTGNTREYIDRDLILMLDYFKEGPYVKAYGGLDNPNTNQRFYKVENGELINWTYKFQNNNNEIKN